MGEENKENPGPEFKGTAEAPETDGWGRDVSQWIPVGGKLKPHP